MIEFALILILAGVATLAWLALWTRQRQELGTKPEIEQTLRRRQEHNGRETEAVIVAREYGQLIYVNEKARQWLGVQTGMPNLEYVARNARPMDSLRGLFAGEPHATFQIGERWVEGTARQIPEHDEIRTVVTLREIDGSGNGYHGEHTLDISTSMRIINEIGETVNASLGVEQVLQSILAIIGKNVDIDAGEITLWDERDERLLQRGWTGDASYVVALATVGGFYHVGDGIAGWCAKHRDALLVSDVRAPDAVKPYLDSNPYQSFVAVPLLLGDHFLGTLSIIHSQPGHFNAAHLALMQAIAKPVATSIYNAELYSAQIKRIDDIASLQRITQEHDAEHDVAGVYMAMNERIATLTNVEVCGVLLFDERRKLVLAQPPFFGLPDGLVRAFSIDVSDNAAAHDLWAQRRHWLSNDPNDDPTVDAFGIAPVAIAAGLRNIALMVMQIGRQKIGMMMLANKKSLSGFSNQDIQNIQILVAQAAVVVENIRLFQREQRHDTELVGLQEITHAIGALSNEDTVYVYSDINTRIAGLMSIQMCGVLLFDDTGSRLVAQLPFYGVDSDLLGDYVIDLSYNEVLQEIWEEQDYWYTNRAMADTVVFSANLAETAERVGVEKTLIAALTAGGRKIGAIQVSNKLNGDDFNDNDARLLLIFATQAAAIIENARLVQEVQRRAEEADRLRLIAERAGNLVTMNETLAPVLSEVARLTDSQLAFLSVISDDTGALVTSPRAVFGAELDLALRFDPAAADCDMLVVNTRAPFFANHPAQLGIYERLAERLGIERMLVVPLFIGERSLGELGIANRATDYNQDDLDILTSVAAQLAATIDRVRLFEAAGENLNRRVQELDAISEVSRTLNATIDLNTILDTIRREAARATAADGSTIAMIRTIKTWEHDTPEIAVRSRIGEHDLIDGLADIEQAALDNEHGDTIVVDDYSATDDMQALPAGTRSAVALAFTYAEIPIGVIHLHDHRPAMFDERAVSFLRTLALKASLGFGNAVRQYEQRERSDVLRQRVEQLNQIFELGQMLQTNVDPGMMLEAIAYSIVQSVGFDVVVITMVDHEAGVLRRETQAGLPVDAFERSKADVLPLNQLDNLLKDELRISESYFYPIETILEWEIAGLDALSAAHTDNRSIYSDEPNAWQDGDMLLVPIVGAGGELLGIISLDRPQNNQRPSRNQIEILEIFAHQAASTIENQRLYVNSLQNAEQEARLNAMLEDIASTLNVDDVVESVAHNVFRLAPFTRVTVALENESESGYTLYIVEMTEDGEVITAKEGKGSLEHTALGRTIRSGVDYVYTRQNDIAAFKDLSEWHGAGEQVSLMMPLNFGGTIPGAIHFGSRNLFEVDDHRSVLGRVANLTAVAIQNARLFNQAVNLQMFNESVLESIQQGIIVLDRSGRVISVNQFIEAEYEWEVEGRRKDIFEYNEELAEHLSEPLRDVLDNGEPRRVLNLRTTVGSTYAIRNFYIYPLVAQTSVNGAVILVEDVTERAMLEENLEARARQLTALTRASGRITSTLQRDQVIELALDVLGEIIEYDMATLWRRISDDTMQLVGVRNIRIEMSPPIRAHIEDVSRFHHIVNTRNVMTIDNLPHFLETYSYALPGDAETGSWLGVPLIHQDYVIGMIAVSKNELGYYAPQAEQAGMAFANQVAVALTNAELFTETRARTERLSVLNRVSLALVQSMDSENIFEISLTEIANALGAEKGRALLFDNRVHIARVIVDHPRSETAPTQQFHLDSRATFRYIKERMQPLVYSHDRANMPEALSDKIRAEVETRGLRDYLLLPMMATGKMIGAFEFETRNGEMALGAETLEIGLIIANQTAIAIQNANQLEEITTRTRELKTLLDAAQSTSLTMDLQQVFETVVDLMVSTLDMDDCAIMIWDDLENVLEVQMDMSRGSDPASLTSIGTRIDLMHYPARMQALRSREVVVISLNDQTTDERERQELIARGNQARMLVPLVVRDQSIGLIQIEVSDVNRTITEQERRLARAMGSQVAIAIENARLSTETAAQMDELFIINDLSQAISSTIDVDHMLNIVREQVPKVTGAREMYVALYDNDTREIYFPLAVRDGENYTIPPRELASDEVSFIIRNKRPLNLDNNYFSAEDLRKSLGLTNGEGDVKSYLGVPLVAGDEVLGVLAVRDRERTRVFGLNDQRILTTVGSQLGATLQNARLFERIQRFADELNRQVDERTEELEEERDRLDMLYQITAELALTLDMDRVLSRALQMIASAVRAHDGVIMLIDPMTDRLYNRASLTRVADIPEEQRQSHPAESLATWLIHNEHELLVDDLHKEDYWVRSAPGAEPWRSAMAVLLETNEDVQGVLVLLSRDIGAFSEPLLNLVIAAANQVASAINNADLYQLIRDQAERLGTLLRTEQEEAEKSNAILEGIADGVMLTDSEGRISLFNSAAETMLGLDRGEVMTRTLTDLIEERGESVAAWANSILQWTEQTGTDDRIMFPPDRLEVGERVVSVNIAPVHNGPQYLGAVSVFRDVTRDVELDKLKNEFILNVTHEFRTPMTNIKGYAELMLMQEQGSELDDGQRHNLSVIKKHADQLASLVEDMLTIAKLDAGSSPISVEDVNLGALVKAQITNSENRHVTKNINVEVHIEEDLPVATLDRRKTMEIIGNIIDNAFNYTPANGNIMVALQRDPERDKHILLTVADDGVGIPQAFQDKIWDRFARYDKHALDLEIPGTGLGLSIVRDLVQMQGGEVWFESEENVGTTFYISFPIEYRITPTSRRSA